MIIKNKNISLRKLILVTTLFLMSFGAFSQDNNKKQQKKTEISIQKKTEISVEIDLASLGFSSFGGHLKIKPKNSEHLLLGIGFYASYYPGAPFGIGGSNFMINDSASNNGNGWLISPLQSYTFSTEYYFSEVNRKWFLGGQLAIHNQKIVIFVAPNVREGFMTASLMTYGGYSWKPFKFNLYIKPWIGVGYTFKFSDTGTLPSNIKYSIQPIAMASAVNLGYTF